MTEQSNPREIIPGTTEPIGPVFDLDSGQQIGWSRVTWYDLDDRAAAAAGPVMASMAQVASDVSLTVTLSLPPDFPPDRLPSTLSLNYVQTRAFLGVFLSG